MRLAYLVNQYPALSHSFIRREIQALERLGHVVERFTIRASPTQSIDPNDEAEAAQTTSLLNAGRCVAAATACLLARPKKLLSAARLAFRFWRNGGGVLRHAAYLAEACRLVLELESRRTEFLHAHFGTNSAAVAALCHRLGGPPFGVTVHGPEEFDRPLTESLGLKIHEAALVIAVSSFGRSQLQRWCDFNDWPKLKVVRCGVDASLLAAEPTDPPTNARFVCVARLSEQKGHFSLLEAASRLATKGASFELILVGDGPLRGELTRRIESLGLSNRVRIVGWQSGEQVRDWLLSARCFILPSFAEGLPVVIMEAFAMNRPVISTFVAGIPELVENGVNGWLAPAGDPIGLADVMDKCLSATADDMQRLAVAGRERVMKRHAIDVEAKLLSAYFLASIDADVPASRHQQSNDPS